MSRIFDYSARKSLIRQGTKEKTTPRLGAIKPSTQYGIKPEKFRDNPHVFAAEAKTYFRGLKVLSQFFTDLWQIPYFLEVRNWKDLKKRCFFGTI